MTSDKKPSIDLGYAMGYCADCSVSASAYFPKGVTANQALQSLKNDHVCRYPGDGGYVLNLFHGYCGPLPTDANILQID